MIANCPSSSYGNNAECKKTTNIKITPEELKYFKIKPGFQVIAFKDFKEIYRGQIASLSYDKVYMEETDVYLLFIHLTGIPPAETEVYVVAPTHKDAKAVKAFAKNEFHKIVDKKQLATYTSMIAKYYGDRPKLSLESLLPEIPAKIKSELPKDIAEFAFRKLDVGRQINILRKALSVNAVEIKLNNKKLTLVQFKSEFINSEHLCLVSDNKIIKIFESPSLEAVFKIKEKLAATFVLCGDTCGIHLLTSDGVECKSIKLYQYDD